MHARIRRMELTTEELDHIINRIVRDGSRMMRAQYDELERKLDVITAERDAAQQELAAYKAGRRNLLDNPDFSVAERQRERDVALERLGEVTAERDALQHDLTTARLHNDDLVRDLEEARAQRDSTKAPAGSILLTEAELADVIGNAITAQRHGRVPQQSAANAVRQYHERNGTAPADAHPLFDVYARWTGPAKGINGHWTVQVFNYGTHRRRDHEVRLFTVDSNGISDVTNYRLHLDGITSIE
jgi:hypothetical protein